MREHEQPAARTFPFDPLTRPVEAAHLALAAAPQAAQGFVIDPDVPLPGSYSFRRVVKLDVRTRLGAPVAFRPDDAIDLRAIATRTSGGELEIKPTLGTACDFWARQAVAARFPAAAVARSVEAAKSTPPGTTDRPDIDKVLSSFLAALDRKEIELPVLTSSGQPSSQLYYAGGRFGGVGAGFYVVEEYRVSAFLERYGLGRTIGTFSLLPGEETTIKLRSWRSSKRSTSTTATVQETATTSIIDSVDEKSIDRFANELQSATGDKTASSSDEFWHVNGEVGGTVGFAHAKVEAGGGGDYKSSQEDFANQATKAVKEHTDEASRNRRNTVENVSSSTQTRGSAIEDASEQENVVERRLKNINLRRVLNYVFRELNQEYDVVVHLVNMRFAFSSGLPGSWREVPPSRLRGLVEEVCDVNVEAGGDGVVDHRKPFAAEVVAAVLGPVSQLLDVTGTYRDVLECVVQSASATEVTPLHTVDGGLRLPAEAIVLDEDLGAIRKGEVVKLYPRFRAGALTTSDKPLPSVPGAIVGRTPTVLRTDNIVVEALLGYSDALDPFAFRSQELNTDAAAAAVELQELAGERIALALKTLEEISDPMARAEAYAKCFPPPPAVPPGTTPGG